MNNSSLAEAGHHWVSPYGMRLTNKKPKHIGWTNFFRYVPKYVITFEGDDLFTTNGIEEDVVVKLVNGLNGAYNMGAQRGYLNALGDR